MGQHQRRWKTVCWGVLLGISLVIGAALQWGSLTLGPPPVTAPVMAPVTAQIMVQIPGSAVTETAPAQAPAPDTGLDTEPTISPDPETATVTFKGLPLFQVAETETQLASVRAAIIQNRLTDNLETWLSLPKLPMVTLADEGDPVIYVGDQPIVTVTVVDAAANQFATPDALAEEWQVLIQDMLQQSYRERQQGYTGRAIIAILGTVLAALLGHELTGIVWRRYLGPLLDRLTFADAPEPHPRAFSAVSLFLDITLALVRGTLWAVAIIHSTRYFLATQRWSSILRRAVLNSFTAEILPLGERSFSITDLLTLLLMLFIMVLATRSLTNLFRARVLQATGINRGVQEAVAILSRYLLLIIGSIMVLQIWGLDLSSLTLLASALGIGVGLGLQNIAKDIGSGLVLVFERPIQVGEFIEFDDYGGVVERIGVRSTEVRTLDQVSIIVPNSRFLDSEVINWSHRNPLSRIHIPIGVAYQSNPEQVRQILLTVARAQADVLAAPPPQVFFQSFGDNSLNFDLLVWTRHPSKQPKLKSDLNFAIAAAFHENGIEIPFPQRDVHFDGGLPITLDNSLETLLRQLLRDGQS